MLKTFILIRWASFAVSTASARIGWTLEQCRQQYGPETPCTPPVPEITDFFTVGKIHLAIHFAADGKADSIFYLRNKSEGEFTDLELKALMDRNCGELSWEHFAPWFQNEYWVSQIPYPNPNSNTSQTTVYVAVKVKMENSFCLWIHTRQFDIDRQKTTDQALEQAATSKLQSISSKLTLGRFAFPVHFTHPQAFIIIATQNHKNHRSRRKVNWIPLPDPITEAEIKIELNWSTDERTRQAIKRQAACMGFESPNEYFHQLIASTLASNEADTVIAKDGRIVCGHYAYDKDGSPQNV